ncbi:DEAD/DEAH box helicase family protein [Cuspidothrix issatschenkoi LEGE 03284]|uniref:type I restriction endonuclease subunit R n=1 Tax=Cuspidothrix issatschenkoi TaxID=230752 RepID=UPI001882C8DE|nr:type I restriction endonuclease subunit R [Cuspidothrix issatschenkoi]MBE9230448.1 DEAD/DEAH box helicase family protein [Cuspidothrix issatschenkoi LEGE 03284]
MSDLSKETDARINIDDLLRQAGWNSADKSQVMTEVSAQMADGGRGRADYLLLDQRGRPLAVIEAKKRAIEPYVAKNQALPYAQNLQAPFIFLSNGELIYFWDYQNDDARIVNSFFSRRDLERLVEMRSTRQPLATIEIPEYYTRQGETRFVRPYQKETMQAMDHAVELGKRRFLLELPTGTGKTDLICLQLKRLIQSGYAEKILFLVDREQLAKQALEAIQDVLNQYGSYWLKPSVIRQEQQITVCLLQTMISRYQEFTSGYFDVVVADECHRSIYGIWQTALTHFDAFHIGLTATPAAYIERNTFDFYNCRNEQPDFSYPIQTAFEQKYLVPYRFATGITEIIAEGAEVDDVYYDPAAFERKWTNEASNRLMMQEFDRLAWDNYQELAPGQKISPGKSIVFALTKNHAARLTRYLNELHPECKGNYAQVITSDVANADDLIRQFKDENYPQVAVSVDMLNTGFNCREVLHLVMCRTVRSPILYQQIRGRGTRTAPHIDKQKFVIYDFFGNHEYFNDSDTDIYADTGRGHVSNKSKTQQSRPRSELIELGLRDRWQQYVSYVEVGTEGERVDKRDYVTNWEQTIQSAVINDPTLQKIRDGELLTETEETELVRRLNTPRYYFNEDNLKRAYRSYNGNLIDFIRAALGILKLKSQEELLEENFRAWLVSHSFAPAQAQYLSLLKNRGIAKGQITIDDLFLPPLSVLNAAGLGIELFGEQGLRDIFDELNRSVFAVDATGTEG